MHIHIGWPQGLFIGLSAIGAGYNIASNARTPGAWAVICGALTSNVITFWLLIWGGFFK